MPNTRNVPVEVLEALKVLSRSLENVGSTITVSLPPIHIHVSPPNVVVQPPEILNRVHVPAPRVSVTVPTPEVHVESKPPDIHIETRAPDVNVTVPPSSVTVQAPAMPARFTGPQPPKLKGRTEEAEISRDKTGKVTGSKTKVQYLYDKE